MNRRSVLHIGGAKTASTTFQRALFLRSPHVHHFGEGGDGVTTLVEETLLASLLEDDEAFLDFGEIKAMFRKHRALADGGTLVFSSADVMLANRPTSVAARLRALLGSEVDVLLVLRNQFSALSSLYSGHGAWLKPAPSPYFRRFVKFDDWLRFQWLRTSSSALASFAYWEQLQPFIAEFGRDQIKLVAFERLVKGDEEAWTTVSQLFRVSPEWAWSQFSGDRHRERISLRQKRYGQVASWGPPISPAPDVRLVTGTLGKLLAGGPRFIPKWPREFLGDVRKYYGAGNTALEQVFALGLADLGYPMEIP